MRESDVWGLRPISENAMFERAEEFGVDLPVEQTPAWYQFEQTFPDRKLVGYFEIVNGDQVVGLVALQRVKYHGSHFLWAKHAPVWLVPETEELEERAVQLLRSWARKNFPLAAFLRLNSTHCVRSARSPMHLVTYDRTVVVDTTGSPEEILARFTSKGRTNVRRSMRRSPIQVTDETREASEDFEPYHKLLAETADRQGFGAWDTEVYENLVRELAPKNVRVFAARDQEGQLCGFSVVTISGKSAGYYYAATNDVGRSLRAPEQLVFHVACALSDEGATSLDLMGIGSDAFPSLDSLSPFKTKFSQQVTEVVPVYDVPLNRACYAGLVGLRRIAYVVRGLLARARLGNTE